MAVTSDGDGQVFPELYLPVMEEANRRSLRPWRKYLPSRAWLLYNQRMQRLNHFIVGIIRNRWAQRHIAQATRPDILGRLLAALQVLLVDLHAQPSASSWYSCTLSHVQAKMLVYQHLGAESSGKPPLF